LAFWSVDLTTSSIQGRSVGHWPSSPSCGCSCGSCVPIGEGPGPYRSMGWRSPSSFS
jgi:hypothetical protein